MTKGWKITLFIILGIILAFASLVYVFFNGLPWKKVMVANEILTYLEQKYDKPLVISERFYNFKDGTYGVRAHPKDDSSIEFSASQGYGNHKFIDNYPEAVWEKQASADFAKVINQLFPENRRYSLSFASGESIDIVKGPEVLNYTKTPATLMINVNVAKDFNDSDIEFERILKLVQFAKHKTKHLDIFIAYEKIADQNADHTVYVTLSKDEIDKINTIDDVKRYYNN